MALLPSLGLSGLFSTRGDLNFPGGTFAMSRDILSCHSWWEEGAAGVGEIEGEGAS